MSSAYGSEKPCSGSQVSLSRRCLRWALRLSVCAGGVTGLLFAAATSLLLALWCAHLGRLSKVWLIAIGGGSLLVQVVLYGWLLWQLARRQWQFRLRSMLIATAVTAAGLALFGSRLHHGWQKQHAVWQAAQRGAHVEILSERYDTLSWFEERFGYDPWQAIRELKLETDEALGAVIDYRSGFHEAERIFVGHGMTDAGLARAGDLSLLPNIDTANVFSPHVTDVGLKHLAKWDHLRGLCLNGCVRITDRGLAELEALSDLEELLILSEGSGTIDISRKGLASIARLPRLQSLILGDSMLSDADLAPLASMNALRVLVLKN